MSLDKVMTDYSDIIGSIEDIKLKDSVELLMKASYAAGIREARSSVYFKVNYSAKMGYKLEVELEKTFKQLLEPYRLPTNKGAKHLVDGKEMTISQIADELDVSTTRVREMLKKHDFSAQKVMDYRRRLKASPDIIALRKEYSMHRDRADEVLTRIRSLVEIKKKQERLAKREAQITSNIEAAYE